MKHLGFYILSIDIDDNGIVGTAELEDADVYQDDTAILHNGEEKFLNLYYQYNPNGYEELGGVKWRLIEKSTINKLQEFWEERNVMWMEDEDSAALTTLVKLRTPQGIQLEKDEIIDEIIQGFKAINWDLLNTGETILDYDDIVENQLPAQIDEIIKEMSIKDGTILKEIDSKS